MSNVIVYWDQRGRCIKNIIQQMSKSLPSRFHSGCICLLKQLLQETELQHSEITSAFSDCLQGPSLHKESFDIDSSDYELEISDDSDIEPFMA